MCVSGSPDGPLIFLKKKKKLKRKLLFPIASSPPLPPLPLLPLLLPSFPPSLPSSSPSSRPPPLPAAALPPPALPSFPCSRLSPSSGQLTPSRFPSHLELQSRPLELQSSGENLCRRLPASPTGLLHRLRACNGAPCREKDPKIRSKTVKKPAL